MGMSYFGNDLKYSVHSAVSHFFLFALLLFSLALLPIIAAFPVSDIIVTALVLLLSDESNIAPLQPD